MILVREEGDSAPEGMEYRHGLTPPMRDVRRRRFRREPDLNVISHTQHTNDIMQDHFVFTFQNKICVYAA